MFWGIILTEDPLSKSEDIYWRKFVADLYYDSTPRPTIDSPLDFSVLIFLWVINYFHDPLIPKSATKFSSSKKKSYQPTKFIVFRLLT